MTQSPGFTDYSYRVDSNDIIVSVSENWRSFAEENSGAISCFPEHLNGTSLWDHISDLETRHLYQIILRKIRQSGSQASFPFRCDSPDKRRFFTLTVISRGDGSIDFVSRLLRTESREPVELLQPGTRRTDEFMRICSMCKKAAISDTEWDEVEVVVRETRLFEREALPQITHGICPPCRDAVITELDELEG